MNYNYMRYGFDSITIPEKGTLYIVSTPIGNLEDITYRAVRILKESDIIAAEDTRTARILLNKYSIKTGLMSYNQHNKQNRTKKILNMIAEEGKNVSLISDAGTPGILDPGYYLIKEAISNQIKVIPIPGSSAILAGLVASGMQMNRFVFEGFLPTKKGRKKKIGELSHEVRTIVLYESPHRLKKSLRELHETFGDRSIVIARELTKKFEEIRYSSLEEAVKYYDEKSIKGEFVLIISGKQTKH